MIDEKLIEQINEELRKEDIDPRTRPLEAMRRLAKELNRSIVIPSEDAELIFDWFARHSKPEIHTIGHFYRGAYYYDATFWTVSIPLIFGSVKVDVFQSLSEMPDSIKKVIKSDRETTTNYVLFWADCIDFAYGFDTLQRELNRDKFGLQLLCAGYEELSTSVSLLLEHKPNKRSILNSRMALEMFIKSFIALKIGLSENEARRIGHDLKAAFNKFIEVSGYSHLMGIETKLNLFPNVNDRYRAQEANHSQLFEAYAIAQSIGTVLTRKFTDINSLPQFFPPPYSEKKGARPFNEEA